MQCTEVLIAVGITMTLGSFFLFKCKHTVAVAVCVLCLVIFSANQISNLFVRNSNEPSGSLQRKCSCPQDPLLTGSPSGEQARRADVASERHQTIESTEGSKPCTSSQEPNGRKCSLPPSPACSAPGLPELVFVAGIEGSGHHVLLSLFESLNNAAGKNPFALFAHIPQIHLLEPDFMWTLHQLGFAFIQEETLRQRIKPVIMKMTENKLQGGKGAVVVTNSFTMGYGGILATARPDLLMLKHLHCKMYKLKIIVTKRHPMPALFSTVSRFGERFKQLNETLAKSKDKLLKDMSINHLRQIMQARLFEDQLIYLNQQLQKLQEDCSIRMHFFEMDNLFVNSTKQSELNQLGDFLELTNEQRQSLFKTHITPYKPFPLPPSCTTCLDRTLYDFFEERKEMWPVLL